MLQKEKKQLKNSLTKLKPTQKNIKKNEKIKKYT